MLKECLLNESLVDQIAQRKSFVLLTPLRRTYSQEQEISKIM